MRIVLSRKGYDSANGGMPSPVFVDGNSEWDGRMFSLPIPEFRKDGDKTGVGVDTGRRRSDPMLPRGLDFRVAYPKGLEGDFFIHHDPDIRRWMHRKPPESWAPVYGQNDGFATHLRGKSDEHIGTGTLFLFFGLLFDDPFKKILFLVPLFDQTVVCQKHDAVRQPPDQISVVRHDQHGPLELFQRALQHFRRGDGRACALLVAREHSRAAEHDRADARALRTRSP